MHLCGLDATCEWLSRLTLGMVSIFVYRIDKHDNSVGDLQSLEIFLTTHFSLSATFILVSFFSNVLLSGISNLLLIDWIK